MTRVDLVTGFLGAGKTTFIHGYLAHLNRKNQRIMIIENEFGSVGVDASFLKNEDCGIEDLSGVCMCCSGRDKFIEMLVDAAARGYDRVLVEPSGIYDVDEFFGVMDAPAIKAQCGIGSVLTIVDASKPERLSEESEYLMYCQLMAAGDVIMSKVQLETPEALTETIAWLNELIRRHGGGRILDDEVCAKAWDALEDADYVRFQNCGFHRDTHVRSIMDHNEIYDSYIVTGYGLDAADLGDRLRSVMADPRYGSVIRAKGYIRDVEKNWYQVNCTRSEISVCPASDIRRGVLVFVGQGLNGSALKEAFLQRVD